MRLTLESRSQRGDIVSLGRRVNRRVRTRAGNSKIGARLFENPGDLVIAAFLSGLDEVVAPSGTMKRVSARSNQHFDRFHVPFANSEVQYPGPIELRSAQLRRAVEVDA